MGTGNSFGCDRHRFVDLFDCRRPPAFLRHRRRCWQCDTDIYTGIDYRRGKSVRENGNDPSGGSIKVPSGRNQISGQGVIEAGDTDVFIADTAVTASSEVIVTPTSSDGRAARGYRYKGGERLRCQRHGIRRRNLFPSPGFCRHVRCEILRLLVESGRFKLGWEFNFGNAGRLPQFRRRAVTPTDRRRQCFIGFGTTRYCGCFCRRPRCTRLILQVRPGIRIETTATTSTPAVSDAAARG